MIQVLFEYFGDFILVRVDGNQVTFANTAFGAQMTDISGLKLDYSGVIKEFPDLEGAANWQEESMRRFKEHIKSLGSEEEKIEYIINELKSKGYTPLRKEKNGHRPTKL